jgi:hypothetical protein
LWVIFAFWIRIPNTDPKHCGKGSSSNILKKTNLQSLVHLSSGRVLQNEIHPSLIVEIAEKPAINIFSRPHKQSSGYPESELRIREANKLNIEDPAGSGS